MTAGPARRTWEQSTLGFSVAPGDLPWESPAPDGTRSATLVGSRLAGVFSYAFSIPAGVWDRPHSHAGDAHLVVVRGALLLGYGTSFRPELAVSHPAGSFLYVRAGAVHFDGALEDTLLIGTGLTPWSTDYD